MKLKRIVVGKLMTNTYVIYNEESLNGVIIDPGDEGKVISNFIDQKKINLQKIILTHSHYDHVGAVMYLNSKFNADVYMHNLDVDKFKEDKMCKSFDFSKIIFIKDKDILKLDEKLLEIIHTPGHTPGSICVYIKKEKMIFTGDTLFDTDIGRMDLAGGSIVDMGYSLKKLHEKLGDKVVVYPGHDESATMEYIRQNNLEFNQYKNK